MRSLPTLGPEPSASITPPCVDVAAHALSRRGFVSAAAWTALASALAGACGGGGDNPTGVNGPSAAGVTYAGGVVTIPLASVPSLAQSGGFLISNGGPNDVRDTGGRRPDVIVINVGADQYRAFTSICTHEQCTVGDFTGTRIRCFCHGSEYDTSGHVAVGPAMRSLTEYPTHFDAATRAVVVTRG
jgi:Rieske Fe-S protein